MFTRGKHIARRVCDAKLDSPVVQDAETSESIVIKGNPRVAGIGFRVKGKLKVGPV